MADLWVLRFLSPGDNYSHLWTLEGNGQSMNHYSFGPIRYQMVYGRRTPRPPAEC